MSEFTINDTKFKWAETSFSGLGRGISMHRVGVKDDQHVYKFQPDPHDDPFYNKNQGKWYDEMARAIAGATLANGWPGNDFPVTIREVEYRLELR